MVKPRYVVGEAWSIAKTSPRQTAAAIVLIAIAVYVPGLLALLARNLSRLAIEDTGEPAAVVITLQPEADARALAARLTSDLRIKTIRIVGSDAALERFRRAFPDIGGALAELREAPFPPSLEIVLKPGASRGHGGADRRRRRGSGPASSRPSPRRSSPGSFATRSL